VSSVCAASPSHHRTSQLKMRSGSTYLLSKYCAKAVGFAGAGGLGGVGGSGGAGGLAAAGSDPTTLPAATNAPAAATPRNTARRETELPMFDPSFVVSLNALPFH